MKDVFMRRGRDGAQNRERAKHFYRNKYFNLFMSAYKFTGILPEQQDYILRKMWDVGRISAFIVAGTKPSEEEKDMELIAKSVNDYPNGMIAFVPFAPFLFNIYDWPIQVNLIGVRGAKFIPTSAQVVNKDCVIGWAHSSHAPIRSLVMYYIDKIVDVEKTIEMNLFVHKLPRLVVVSPEDKDRVADLMDKIEAGEKKLFLDANDVQAIKNVLESGSNTSYIIDKLYQYKQNLENELSTFLGINNNPVEKAERLITGEVNSNNQLISECGACFDDTIDIFCEEVSKVLNFPLTQEVEEFEEEQGNPAPESEGEENA